MFNTKMISTKGLLHALPVIALTAALAGCGGGGGSSNPPVNTAPTVTSVKASNTQVAPGAQVTFTISGSNLAITMSATLSGGTCQAPSGTASELTVTCTAPSSGSSATFDLTSGGTVVAGSSSTVTLVATPSVSSITTTPFAPVETGTAITVTVNGSDLSTAMTGTLSGGGTCQAPTGTTSSISFACTTPSSGSSTTFTLADGGTAITGTATLSIALAAPASYQAGSITAYMFADINAYRQECGFPAVQENTILDQAAASHAIYMQENGGMVTDYEVQGNPGFTGVTPQDRAAYFGWPLNTSIGAVDGAFVGPPETNQQYAQFFVNHFGTGVYHAFAIDGPFQDVGLGTAPVSFSNGLSGYLVSESIAQPTPIAQESALPLTFPCTGVTNIPYLGTETPMPPNVTGIIPGTTTSAFGTPVSIVANMDDTVTVQSATYTDESTGAAVTPIEILNSSNDPNHELGLYEAAVYPSAPLNPDTTYTVVINGTINGNAFTRTVSFTTGSLPY